LAVFAQVADRARDGQSRRCRFRATSVDSRIASGWIPGPCNVRQEYFRRARYAERGVNALLAFVRSESGAFALDVLHAVHLAGRGRGRGNIDTLTRGVRRGGRVGGADPGDVRQIESKNHGSPLPRFADEARRPTTRRRHSPQRVVASPSSAKRSPKKKKTTRRSLLRAQRGRSRSAVNDMPAFALRVATAAGKRARARAAGSTAPHQAPATEIERLTPSPDDGRGPGLSARSAANIKPVARFGRSTVSAFFFVPRIQTRCGRPPVVLSTGLCGGRESRLKVGSGLTPRNPAQAEEPL